MELRNLISQFPDYYQNSFMKKEIKIYIDSIHEEHIQGWFINTPTPKNNKILLFLDKKYKAVTLANSERQDVAEAHGQLLCGFCFDIKKFSSYRLLELKSENKELLLSLKVENKQTGNKKQTVKLMPLPYSSLPYKKLEKLKIDLSKEINGHNWYSAEPSGRWGGPELESTLSIPALAEGDYRLELEIGNDYCDLETLEVMFNKKPVNFLNSEFNSPILLQAEIQAEKQYPFWHLSFNYSKTLSPEGDSGADQRKLGLFLKTVNLTKISSSN